MRKSKAFGVINYRVTLLINGDRDPKFLARGRNSRGGAGRSRRVPVGQSIRIPYPYFVWYSNYLRTQPKLSLVMVNDINTIHALDRLSP